MTSDEALDILVAADPSRTWIATKANRRFNHCPDERLQCYTVSVLPGIDGTNCQQIDSSEGFDQPVALFLKIINPAPVTPNNE